MVIILFKFFSDRLTLQLADQRSGLGYLVLHKVQKLMIYIVADIIFLLSFALALRRMRGVGKPAFLLNFVVVIGYLLLYGLIDIAIVVFTGHRRELV